MQTEQSVLVHGKISPATDLHQEHAAPVATPHLPITATTKVAEIKGPGSPISPAGSPPSPVSEESPVSQSAAGTKQRHQSTEEPVPAGDWFHQHHRLVPPSGQGAHTYLFFFRQYLPHGPLHLSDIWDLHTFKVSSLEDNLPGSVILFVNESAHDSIQRRRIRLLLNRSPTQACCRSGESFGSASALLSLCWLTHFCAPVRQRRSQQPRQGLWAGGRQAA